MPVKTYLHIWDAFLFEGSKVLFRYAIAIFKYMETGLLKQGDYMSIYNTLRDGLEYLTDTQTLTQVKISYSLDFIKRSQKVDKTLTVNWDISFIRFFKVS